MNYNWTQCTLYGPKKLVIDCILRLEVDSSSNCCDKFKKAVTFDERVQSISDENSVIYIEIDSGITFYTEEVNRERKQICGSCENPKSIPSKVQQDCFTEEQLRSTIFKDPYIFMDVDPAASLSLNHPPDKKFVTIHFSQSSTHQPRTYLYPVISSLRPKHSKKKRLRFSVALSQKIRRTNERKSSYC